ncbi:MAG TPA: hypothetical protein V6D28_09980 [Leptolyngbyaceae cyanobacterium]
MPRPQQIDRIIQQRQPLAQKITKVEAQLNQLSTLLSELQTYCLSLLTQLPDPVAIAQLQQIDLVNLNKLIVTELKTLSKLKTRFSRPTLNIGVVGRARQGKSRFLQTLSGLTAAEIPDGDRLHCTGVSSTIHHNPNPNEPAYGLVWFHSEQSFLEEIIHPYYEKLRLGTPPATLQDFAQQPLPSLPGDLKIYAAPKAMHEHLTDYRDKLGKYYGVKPRYAQNRTRCKVL